MKQYDVTGMSCAACSARVEKAVSEVPGMTSCSVSLLTNSMGVEGTASASAIIDAVQKAGYGASEKGSTKTTSAQSGHDEELKDTETPKMLRRLIVSVIFWMPLMYIMCWMLWDWPLPAFFAENHLALMMFEMLLTIIVMVVNQKAEAAKGEEETMQTIEKTMKVEGMMCSHCEASVKKALEAVPGVKSAEASAAAGEAYLIMAPETAEAELIKAVEAAGYTVNE